MKNQNIAFLVFLALCALSFFVIPSQGQRPAQGVNIHPVHKGEALGLANTGTTLQAATTPTYLVSYSVTYAWGTITRTGTVKVTTNALITAQTAPGNPQRFLDEVISAAYASGDLEGISLAQRGNYFEVLGWHQIPVGGNSIFSTRDPDYGRVRQ